MAPAAKGPAIPDESGMEGRVVEFDVALEYAVRGRQLHRAVLFSLLSGPQRFSGLTSALAGRAENNLTVALTILQKDALIARRVAKRSGRKEVTYRLTELGVAVCLELAVMDRLRSVLADQAGRSSQDVAGVA